MLFYNRFRVNSEPDQVTNNIELILAWLAPFSSFSIHPKDWCECRLAIIEAFTNVVYHAHRTLPSHTPIWIDITGYTDYIEVCIWDRGKLFDLRGYLAQLPELIDQEVPHGRGLIIIDKVADELDFVRVENHRNGLVLVKYRQADADPCNPDDLGHDFS